MPERSDVALFEKYNPIDSEAKYDRKTFVKAYKTLDDIAKDWRAFEEKPHDANLQKKLVSRLSNEPGIHLARGPDHVSEMGKFATTHGYDAMVEYTHGNLDEFLNAIDDDKAVSALVTKVPVYKNGDARQDKVVATLGTMREMQQALYGERRDDDKIRGTIVQKLKGKERLTWGEELILYHQGDSEFMASVYSMMLGKKNKEFQKLLSTESAGKLELDKGFIKHMVRESIKVANEQLEKETDSGARSDIVDDVIKPIYLGVAEIAYGVEKKKLDAEDTEKIEKDKRKAERRSLGMAA